MTLAVLVVAASGCSRTGIPVTVLSRSGPDGLNPRIILGTSVDQIRHRVHANACGTGRPCWPDAPSDVRSDLIVAALVQGCAPVDSVTASLASARFLSIQFHQQFSMGCEAASPMLWLYAVPLSSLPPNGVVHVEVQGMTEGTITAAITLPVTGSPTSIGVYRAAWSDPAGYPWVSAAARPGRRQRARDQPRHAGTSAHATPSESRAPAARA